MGVSSAHNLMNHYKLSTNDQKYANWIAFDQHSPYFERASVPPKYYECVCDGCNTVDHDHVFKIGFKTEPRIRAKGDMFDSSDGFLCVNTKVKDIIEEKGYGVARRPKQGDMNGKNPSL